MDLLLHIVDASAEDRQQQEMTVIDLLKELEMDDIPMLTIYNKADRIDEFSFAPTLFPSVLISAKTNKGKELLAEAIKREIMNLLEPYILTLNADEGQALSEMKRETLVLSENFDEENEQYIIRGFAKKKSLWIRRMEDELDD
jgi:GTP-binding protein HflX